MQKLREYMELTRYIAPEDLKVGDALKFAVPAKIGEMREWPWAQVTAVNDDGTCVAIIDNDLVFTESHGFKYQDVCIFRHVNDDDGYPYWEVVKKVN